VVCHPSGSRNGIDTVVEVPTIFAVPKPFRGHIGLIQTNALRSWLALRPQHEVILLGAEEGVAAAAALHGVRHIADVARNEFGTPLLNDVFRQAEQSSSSDTLCYVNADIILLSDFPVAVAHVRQRKRRFLMVGKRWDIDLGTPLDVAEQTWEEGLRSVVATSGQPRTAEWVDYFVFNRGLFQDLLPFALGRAAFDNWLLWKATASGAALVDASDQVLAVHQNHDYAHHPQGQKGVWEGVEAERNRELMETWSHCFFLTDASHRLTKRGVRPIVSRERLRRTWDRRGRRQDWRQLRVGLLIHTYPVRRRLGLRRKSLATLARRWRRIVER
jgi:hypothetical protein